MKQVQHITPCTLPNKFASCDSCSCDKKKDCCKKYKKKGVHCKKCPKI